MRVPPSLLIIAGCGLVAGCGTEPLSVERNGAAVASSLGVPEDEVRFVSYGDVARADELDDGYSEKTKGIVAITKTDLYWGKGELETLRLSDLARVPLAQISGASLDYDLVQLEISGELMVIRPHSWNRYEGDVDRSLEVLALLSEIDVPFFAVTRSYRDPADYHSSLGTGLYGEASPEAAIARAQAEAADVNWALHAGKDGVPLTPPSERLVPGRGRP